MKFENSYDKDDNVTASFSTDDYIEEALKLRNLSVQDLSLSSALSSDKSIQISLKEIGLGKAGLSKHRQNMLNRVPEIGQYALFKKDSIEIQDLAYLSAHEGHEFALIRSKNNDILFHGSEIGCDFDDMLKESFINGKLSLIAHSHPDREKIIPSSDDREFLRQTHQSKSIIISWYTGKQIEFSADDFE